MIRLRGDLLGGLDATPMLPKPPFPLMRWPDEIGRRQPTLATICLVALDGTFQRLGESALADKTLQFSV